MTEDQRIRVQQAILLASNAKIDVKAAVQDGFIRPGAYGRMNVTLERLDSIVSVLTKALQ